MCRFGRQCVPFVELSQSVAFPVHVSVELKSRPRPSRRGKAFPSSEIPAGVFLTEMLVPLLFVLATTIVALKRSSTSSSLVIQCNILSSDPTTSEMTLACRPASFSTWEWQPSARIRGFTHPVLFSALYNLLQIMVSVNRSS